jgi:hypothetical protein
MCFKSNHKEDSSKRIYCEKCNRHCFNQKCLENHSEVCERFHKCLKCNKILKRGDKMVDEGKKMVEEGNKIIEEGNNKKGNQIIKKGNKMIGEGSKEHRCGWEKCRNCYKIVIKSINLRIIDSSNFVQGPLKNFPKTFGLKELKKGYFPHFFNTTENQNYIGKIPDTKYYGVNSMKPKEREEFLEWHKQKRKE